MIKTFTINLANQLFNINEDAYESLLAYFASLDKFYANEEGKDEIIADIKDRFAELFLAKGKNHIITKEDTDLVINMMGKPQEFDDEEQQSTQQTAAKNTVASSSTITTGKRLYRDFDNGLVTGVCAGLSAYFGIADPIWIRILFIISPFITFGTALLAYIILWIIMPKAETATQKLEMKGEPINLSSIEKNIKEEAHHISTIASNDGKGIFYKILNVFVSLISLFIKFLLIIFKFIGVILLGSIVLAIFGFIIAFVVISFIGAPAASKYFFTNSSDYMWIVFGGIFILSTLFVLFSVLFYNRIYKNDKHLLRKLALPLVGFFILGIVLLNIGANKIRTLLSVKKSINQSVPLSYNIPSDTLQITINPSIKDEEYNNVEINSVSDLLDFIGDNKDNFIPVEIEIYQSANDSFMIVKEFSARGKNETDALQNATTFRHSIAQNNNKIIIDPYIQFDFNKAKYRNQKLKLKVYVPEGKIIKWDKRTEEYIDLGKVDINWDNILYPTSPIAPLPPLPPLNSTQNHKIEIKTSKNHDSVTSSKIVINIDSENENVNEALDKAQDKIDEAREKFDALQDDEKDIHINISDSDEDEMEARIHRQHYIFRMVNGELIPLD
jgi:phage shock protein PspC (stress-responsive transcriptional regulator)